MSLIATLLIYACGPKLEAPPMSEVESKCIIEANICLKYFEKDKFLSDQSKLYYCSEELQKEFGLAE